MRRKSPLKASTRAMLGVFKRKDNFRHAVLGNIGYAKGRKGRAKMLRAHKTRAGRRRAAGLGW